MGRIAFIDLINSQGLTCDKDKESIKAAMGISESTYWRYCKNGVPESKKRMVLKSYTPIHPEFTVCDVDGRPHILKSTIPTFFARVVEVDESRYPLHQEGIIEGEVVCVNEVYRYGLAYLSFIGRVRQNDDRDSAVRDALVFYQNDQAEADE